jgi:hypothetical protein
MSVCNCQCNRYTFLFKAFFALVCGKTILRNNALVMMTENYL